MSLGNWNNALHTILLCIGYDGTNFHGYQSQNNARTVQDVLEEAITQCLGKRIATHSSGRTDAGVHAERQYVHFKIDSSKIPSDRISYALHSFLPEDIRVYWSKEVSNGFHARYSARSRCYYYQLYEGEILPPTLRNQCMNIPLGLDWRVMQSELDELLGTHDFSSFSSFNEQTPSYVRNLIRAEIVHEQHNIKRIYLEADGFLWKMVRTIIGTLIERSIIRKKGNSNKVLLSMSDILNKTDRSFAGTTAPPWGLFLFEVQYKEEYRTNGRNSTY